MIVDEVVFSTDTPVLFSAMAEKKLGLALQWKPWKSRYVQIQSNGYLVYSTSKDSEIKETYSLDKVTITEMSGDRSEKDDIGVIVKCHTLDGFETYFRCIFTPADYSRFTDVIKIVSKEHNLNMGKKQINIEEKMKKKRKVRSIFYSKQSIMRRTIANEMDKFDSRSKRDRIISRRGAMRWLPVLFSNDLIHGSWWFVVGSIMFFGSSIVMLYNSFDNILGDDDSGLTIWEFRATWALMILSGLFSTLGSMAFVRAVHQDPPMKPYFPHIYHFQNDELLGSWLFFFAVIPFIPYCLIYLSDSQYTSVVYAGGLIVSILMVFGTYLFVRACYPTDKERMKVLKPIARILCYCCCSKAWMKKHLANDWLAGTWFIFWATFIGTFACGVILLVALARMDHLKIFLVGTAFIENVCFLLGSAYFVSGSYPEIALTAQGDDNSSVISGYSESTSNNNNNSSNNDLFSEFDLESNFGDDFSSNNNTNTNTSSISNNVNSSKNDVADGEVEFKTRKITMLTSPNNPYSRLNQQLAGSNDDSNNVIRNNNHGNNDSSSKSNGSIKNPMVFGGSSNNKSTNNGNRSNVI